jgi:hypothetical protein
MLEELLPPGALAHRLRFNQGIRFARNAIWPPQENAMHSRAAISAPSHGEHGAVVRLLTADHGHVAAYVAGARGREMRPLLIPGNVLDADLRAQRQPASSARIELVTSRGPWLTEPLPARRSAEPAR